MRTPHPVLLLLLAGLAACEPAPPREQLDAHALHVQAQQLESLASEAVLLTREIEAGHLNRAFVWVHQQDLADDARQVAAGLGQPAPTQLQPAQREGMLVIAALQSELTQVAGVQGDAAELRALRARFEQLRQRAHALEPAP